MEHGLPGEFTRRIAPSACPSSAWPDCRAIPATSLPSGGSSQQHPTEPRTVVALDYRGRGLSDPSPDWRSYTPSIEAQDVLAATAALALPGVIVVGTSRGGLIAMLLGALQPTVLAGVCSTISAR
jgi:pimeloyl-ACP methyl ester carboxylesterase